MADSLPDHRFAGTRQQALDRLDRIGALSIAQFDDAPGQHQAPGRGVDKHAVRRAEMFLPRPAGNFVGNELVRRLAVGNPQQRFGETHQDDALIGRQAILVHEGIDAGVIAFVGAGGVHQAASDVGGAAALVLGEHGALDQAAS